MGDTKVTLVVETIDPARAEKYLGKNVKNRPLRGTTVAKYARMMADGRWHLDGNTVKFDKHGNLLDGQHRLQAVVRSGTTVQMAVARGLEPEVFDSLDRPYVRSAGQALGIAGVANSTVVAGAAFVMALDEAGEMGGAWGQRFEPTEIRAIVERHPALVQAAAATYLLAPKLGVSSGVLAWAYYRFHEIDATLCDAFFSSLSSGTGLGETDPIHVLRERFLSSRRGRTGLDRKEAAVLVVRAWNAVVTGRNVNKLQLVRRDAAKDEGFPKIRRAR